MPMPQAKVSRPVRVGVKVTLVVPVGGRTLVIFKEGMVNTDAQE